MFQISLRKRFSQNETLMEFNGPVALGLAIPFLLLINCLELTPKTKQNMPTPACVSHTAERNNQTEGKVDDSGKIL